MDAQRAIMLCAAIMLIAATWTEEPPLIYQNDFEDGIEGLEMTDSKAWKHETDGDTKVLALTQSSDYRPAVRSPQSIAWIEDLSVSDFVLEVDLKQTGREYGHRDLCLFFGRNDESHFYYVHLATQADDRANSIFLVNGSPRVSIAIERTDGTAWTSGYHKVRIERKTASGEITVYFDDMTTPTMRAIDKTFIAGAIGFGSFDDQGFFDNVQIWGKRD